MALRRGGRWAAAAVFLLTVVQLAVAATMPGLKQFAGKGFTARLVVYPAMMLLAPAVWWLLVRRRGRSAAVPWIPFTWIMLPFLIDGVGAIMAIGWELGEYVAFIRGGTELATAYTDTLGDLVLGTLGAAAAGALVAWGPWTPRPVT